MQVNVAELLKQAILWVYGKLNERSLSLIVTGDEYKDLIKEAWFKETEPLTFDKAEEILEIIKSKRKG